jgi:hypothetical protein
MALPSSMSGVPRGLPGGTSVSRGAGTDTTRPRVLYLIHGHAQRVAGGAERHALELFRGIRASGSFAPILLARSRDEDPRRSGTPGYVLEPPDHLLLHSAGAPGAWDRFLGQPRARPI